MPEISVIVPVCRVEKYLKEALDSLLLQTFQDFEAILVDDGSPDNCPQILDEYAKKDKRFLAIHQSNQGVSVARNNGLQKERRFIIKHLIPNILKKELKFCQKANAGIAPLMYQKFAKELQDLYSRGLIKIFYHRLDRYFIYRQLIKKGKL